MFEPVGNTVKDPPEKSEDQQQAEPELWGRVEEEVTPVDTLSNLLPRFQPAWMPIQTPTTVATIVAVPSRIKCPRTAARITSQTGFTGDGRVGVERQWVLEVVDELLPHRCIEFFPELREGLRWRCRGALVPRERVTRQQLKDEEVERTSTNTKVPRRGEQPVPGVVPSPVNRACRPGPHQLAGVQRLRRCTQGQSDTHYSTSALEPLRRPRLASHTTTPAKHRGRSHATDDRCRVRAVRLAAASVAGHRLDVHVREVAVLEQDRASPVGWLTNPVYRSLRYACR